MTIKFSWNIHRLVLGLDWEYEKWVSNYKNHRYFSLYLYLIPCLEIWIYFEWKGKAQKLYKNSENYDWRK